MSEPLIQVENLGIAYRLARNRVGTLKEFAIRAAKRQVTFEKLWAVRGVSFEVPRGEVFGVLGPNGAGKSSLMKAVARVLPPSEGRVVVRGTLAPMIELGAGFNSELSARENIVMYGALLGRPPELMRERTNDILTWADLLEFADVPTRSFSTGMLARLGFSVATDTEPDVLVVDEVLSVGDEAFQLKSKTRLRQLMESGVSVVVVSHNLGLIEEMAHRAMWMDHGKTRMIGVPTEVIGAYREWAGAGESA